MNRRTFVLGLGAASASTVALGTGAFTSVEAERDVSVELAEDANAYLGLESQSEYAIGDTDGTIEIDFTSDNPTDAGGEHFNLDAVTIVEDVFAVQNLGTQDDVQIEFDPDGVAEAQTDVEVDFASGSIIVVLNTWAFVFFPQDPEIISEGEEVAYGALAFHSSEPLLGGPEHPEEPNEFEFTLEITAETTNPGSPAENPPSFDLDEVSDETKSELEGTVANHHYAD
ncbi:hypothetical protein [Natrarchaeobaculum sulfurireducens]|uniref:hypothetical protein n=1 Tax=Natrarchaeobaculum sulfurireducens TaxID=2044521 RepID=UPI000E3C8885|nr:hypothetical protein [Natrarchaeobaculum sulfurireducens]